MKKKLFITCICLLLVFSMAACGGTDSDTEEPAAEPVVEQILGVITANAEGDQPAITMLVDGEEKEYPIDSELFDTVLDEWDDYSHWGMYEATLEDGTITKLEYGEGVSDIIGIYANYDEKKVLSDVISVNENTVTIDNIGNILKTEPDADVPGFSSKNEDLTPADGETFELADSIVVYTEGEDALFAVGDISDISKPDFDYIEFYDIDGDGIYDQVIVWRTDYSER